MKRILAQLFNPWPIIIGFRDVLSASRAIHILICESGGKPGLSLTLRAHLARILRISP